MSISLAECKNLPDAPGVYFFLGKRKKPQGRSLPPHLSFCCAPRVPFLVEQQNERCGGLRLVIHTAPKQVWYGAGSREVLYIGKAGSLRDRVRSYFARDIAEARGAGIEQMVGSAEDIACEKTDSVFEAVLLEAELIKKYQPKYNVREKDDKSFNYVVITKEDFPRVLLVRGRELSLKTINYKLKTTFGPFPHGGTLRAALSIIRKIFPYRDKCTPLQHSNILQNVRMSRDEKGVTDGRKKSCFNRQIGLCPGVCAGEMTKQEYAKIIRNIVLLFRGRKKTLLKNLAREMKAVAKARAFERAAKLRDTIFALKHIQDISLLKRETFAEQRRTEPQYQSEARYGARRGTTQIKRIEAYDVAHISGKEIVGVMVTVYGGEPEKSAYRKFRIKNITASNDTAALKEILERRLAHAEWPFPDLVVVDGGKAQINVALRVLKESGLEAPVVGVVKDERHRPKNILGDMALRKKYENEILLANSEAHRFAINYHREKMRSRK